MFPFFRMKEQDKILVPCWSSFLFLLRVSARAHLHGHPPLREPIIRLGLGLFLPQKVDVGPRFRVVLTIDRRFSTRQNL